MKKRVAWFWVVLPILLIFGVPQLRAITRMHLTGSGLINGPYWLARFWPGSQISGREGKDWFDASDPDNAVVTLGNLTQGRQLIDAHPRRADLIAFVLIRNTLDWIDNRVVSARNRGNTIRPSLNPSQLALVEKWARQGRALEPDNAFFDAVLALCLFGQSRDAEAMAAMRAGAAKSRYDEHSMDIQRARLRFFSRQRGLTLEEKTMLRNDFNRRLWQRLAEFVAWQARQSKARGQEKSGLQDAAALARLMGRAMRQSETFWQLNEPLQAQVWLWRNALSDQSQSRNRVNKATNAAAFAQSARKVGLPEIARETGILATENRQFERLYLQWATDENVFDYLFGGGRIAREHRLPLWAVLQIFTVYQVLFLAICAVFLSLFLWRSKGIAAGRRGRIWLVGSAAALTWLPLLILAPLLVFTSRSTWQQLLTAVFFALLNLFFLAPVLLIPFCETAKWRRFGKEFSASFKREDLGFAPWAQWLYRYWLPILLWSVYPVAFLMVAAQGLISWLDGWKALELWGQATAFGRLVDIHDWQTVMLWIAFGGPILFGLGWVIHARIEKHPMRQIAAHSSLRWLRDGIKTLAIWNLWFYLALLIFSLPARHAADAQFDALLEKGEINHHRGTETQSKIQ